MGSRKDLNRIQEDIRFPNSMANSPISHHSAGGGPEKEGTEPSQEERAQMEQAYQQMQRKMRIDQMDEKIKHKVMVLSGKGLSLIHI